MFLYSLFLLISASTYSSSIVWLSVLGSFSWFVFFFLLCVFPFFFVPLPGSLSLSFLCVLFFLLYMVLCLSSFTWFSILAAFPIFFPLFSIRLIPYSYFLCLAPYLCFFLVFCFSSFIGFSASSLRSFLSLFLFPFSFLSLTLHYDLLHYIHLFFIYCFQSFHLLCFLSRFPSRFILCPFPSSK